MLEVLERVSAPSEKPGGGEPPHAAVPQQPAHCHFCESTNELEQCLHQECSRIVCPQHAKVVLAFGERLVFCSLCYLKMSVIV